jgi:leader peptidase (prepilin peptidase)/N-methyltransferase
MESMAAICGGILLGLLIGSFLNVVIYRLPVMLEREWLHEARSLLADGEPPVDDSEPFNLVTPRSRCQSCGAQIAAWQNIPVISWLLLGGRCAACKTSISARYPLIELITGALSGAVVWQFGSGPAAGVILVLVWSLIALTMIDIDHMFLPDKITLPLLWLGLLVSLLHEPAAGLPFADIRSAILGAVVGYLTLWSVYWLFKLITGKEGMGYGDFKLLAALGAWLGLKMIPLIIMLSAMVGTVVGIIMVLALGRDRQIPIPFGPYLAGAGLIALFWGESIVAAYLQLAGI